MVLQAPGIVLPEAVIAPPESSGEDLMAHRAHPAGRTLHVIDIENLVGGSGAGPAAVGPALSAYRSTVAVRDGDHAVIAAGPTLAIAAGLAWPGAQLRFGHGIDGADHALLDAVEPAFAAEHYDRVVIASGDHAFVPLVAALRSRGAAVVLVVRDRESLSIDLGRLAMHRTLPASS